MVVGQSVQSVDNLLDLLLDDNNSGEQQTSHSDNSDSEGTDKSGSSGGRSTSAATAFDAVADKAVPAAINVDTPALPEYYVDQSSRVRQRLKAQEAIEMFPAYTPGSTKKGKYRWDMPHIVPWSAEPVGFCNVPWRTMRRSHFNGKCQERGRIAGYTAPSGLSRTERQSTLRRVKEQRESLQQTEGKTRMTMAPVRLTKAKMHALPPPPPPPQKPKPAEPAKVPQPSPRMPAASGGFVQIPSGLEPAPAPAPAPAPSDSLEDPLMQLLKPIAAALVQRTLETVLMNVLTGQTQ